MDGADKHGAKVAHPALAFLRDGGTVGALVRAHDWAASPLGPPQGWPQPLRTLVGVMLTASQPMFVAWGPGRTLLYNDAYAQILANKHPAALGRDFLDVWHEIRADLLPIVETAYAGRPVHMDDIALVMHRRGYPEETHFTFSYTPVLDETGAVAGFFCPCQEITGQVLAERGQAFRLTLEERLRALADPEAVMTEALGLLGTHLGLDRVGYSEVVNASTVRLASSYVANGMAPLIGEFPLESFGQARIARQRQGLTEVCDDVLTDPEQDNEVWAAIDTRSLVSVPLVRDGQFRASLYANNREPRHWAPEDVVLIEEVAARTWDAVERARAEAALRASEARFRLTADAVPQIVWVTDAEGRTEFFNKHWSDYTGIPYEPTTAAEVAANHVHLDDEAATVAAFNKARRTGTTFLVEHRIRSASGEHRWFLVRAEPYRDPETGRIVRWFGSSVDIHDRRQAEAELRDSEQRLRAIVDTATDYAIFTTDAEGRIETWPAGAHEVFGWTAAEAIGQLVDMTFTPEDRAVGAPETERIAARTAGQSPNVRWHLRRDGSRVFIDGITRPLRGKDGTVTGFVKVGQDVTERRAIEDALRASEARLAFLDRLGAETAALADADAVLAATTRLVGEHMAVSLCAYADMDEDQDGFTIRGDWAAPGSRSIVGRYRLADFGRLAVKRLGAGLPLVVHDNLRELAPEEAATFQSIGIAATICMPLVKDGRLAALMAIHDRAPRIWTDAELGLLREVTARSWAHVERVAATAELRESEARLRAVLDATPVGLVFADTTGRIVGANARVEEIIGQPILPTEDVERYGADYVAFHADGRRVEGHEYPLAQVVRGEAERAELEVQVPLPDDSRRWVRYIATPVRDEDGRSIGAVVASLDIDWERRLTEHLAREVEAAVAKREEAQEQLRQSQKMEAMGQLTGGVAHDFNNLLTPIIASLDMLQRRGLGSTRERRLIDGALQSAERAKTLVQRLLAFARRQPLQPRAVDVGALVHGMADLIASTTGPRIDVRLELAADLPPALADANQLEMALLNLAVNARDAMADGGALTITAARESVHRRHEAKLRHGHYVRLSVTDTGTGMDEATRARAVEPFFSTKGVGRGTGLGLSMVHGLASQLGGGLTISSRPGQGTTVDLWLPISAVVAEEKGRAPDPPSPRQARGTALLVDDEDLVRLSTADMLQDLGFDVVEAGSAEEALRLVGEGLDPDLVVSDHLMPGLSGVELARDLRARRPDLPVLIVSGYAEMEGIAPGLPRLTKPFRAAELAASLTALMSVGA